MLKEMSIESFREETEVLPEAKFNWLGDVSTGYPCVQLSHEFNT